MQLFGFFDLYNLQKLDCQSLFLAYDLLLSTALGCRLLYLYNYQSLILQYMQYEQNSQNVLKSRLFEFVFLLSVNSVEIYRYSHMVSNCVVNVDVQLAYGLIFRVCRAVEREIV